MKKWTKALSSCLVAVVFGLLPASLPQEQVIHPEVPFVPTPQPVVEQMLKMAQVTNTDLVYDLGCGDGRIVITAAKEFGARAVGVDIDPRRIRECLENARQAGVEEKVKFLQQDLFKTDLKEATVVTLYLLPSVNIRLRPKLLEELRPGARVVSHDFDMDEWKPDQTRAVDGHRIYLWIIPAKIGGQWKISMNNPNAPWEEVLLTLNQKFQFFDGNAKAGIKDIEVKDGRIRGDRISFTLGEWQFVGRVRDGEIRGTVRQTSPQSERFRFTATRVK